MTPDIIADIALLVLKLIGVAISAYLIGSIPTGYIIVKALKGIDIREIGSGSTGATNVKRVLGTKWFFIVMILDALKGAIPVLLTAHYLNFTHFKGLSPVIAALFVIIGHCRPLFLKFKGGKSVATGIGTIIALCWPVGLIMAAVWGIITYLSKYVSLGSIIAISMAPILMNLFDQNIYYIYFAAICAIVVIILHKDNIKRLVEGKENKVRE